MTSLLLKCQRRVAASAKVLAGGLLASALIVLSGCGGSEPAATSSTTSKNKTLSEYTQLGQASGGGATLDAANKPTGAGTKQLQAASDLFSANGWWWDSSAPGTGFSFETQGDTGFLAFFMYDDSGKATWYAASGPFDGTRFVGDLFNRTNGQAAGNPSAVAPAAGATPGPISITFSGNNAQVSLPNRSFAAQRFNFNGLNTTTGNQPESGWWWNASQAGRGYALEVQGNSIFLAMFHYNPDGSPTWNVVSAPLAADNSFSGTFSAFINGQTLNGAYRPNAGAPALGSVSGRFTGACSGTLTLPGNINVAIEKFAFGPNPCRKSAPPTGYGAGNLNGKVTAEIVPQNYSTGSLNYAQITTKPARGVRVDVLNATSGTLITSTTTDGQGNYYATVPNNTNVTVQVYSQMKRTGSGPNWDVTVRDNTSSGAIYVLTSPTFNTGSTTVTQNLLAGSGWGGSSYTGTRASGPFAILDTIYNAMQRVTSASPNQAFPPLNVFWSVNNSAASGTASQGQIGTTYFTQENDGSRSIYVLGLQNNDTDEFDATVVAHEYGHYFQSSFSRDDSVGGSHSGGDSLDPRVAFSEGWGNAWSGMALGVTSYGDSNGASQSRGFALDLRAPATSNPGWYRENSVQYLMFNLYQTNGFAPVWSAMTGPLVTNEAFTTIFSFADSLNRSAPSVINAFRQNLLSQNINSIDQFGAGETNNGGFPGGSGQYGALPLYKSMNVGQTTSICSSSRLDVDNKLGVYNYLTLNITSPRTYNFSVSGGTDPDFVVYKDGKAVISAVSGNPGLETASAALSAGRYVLAVNEAQFQGVGLTNCFNLLVQ